MDLERELSELANDSSAIERHVLAFRKNYSTCTNCLEVNKDVTIDKCLNKCSFYKEKTLYKNEDVKVTRKLVSRFYTNHPVPNLVLNKVRDFNTVKRALEYLTAEQILMTIAHMHRKRMVDINQIHYVYNQALYEVYIIEQQSVVDTAANLVKEFYHSRPKQLVSPNLFSDVSKVELALEQERVQDVKGILKHMKKLNYSDLRLFAYVRNEYLNQNLSDTRLDYVDETDLLGE